MQAFICEVVRARTKLGIAMAASRPMMATTIMISTSVNPDFLIRFNFIANCYLSLSRPEQSDWRVLVIMIAAGCSVIASREPLLGDEHSMCHRYSRKNSVNN